jgi:hypothetical protein
VLIMDEISLAAGTPGRKTARMKLLTNVAEIWAFARTERGPRYLLVQASQQKADTFFGGHRFWQIPGTSMRDDGEDTVDLLCRGLAEYGLEARALWVVEHVSTIFNRRFDAIQIIPAFAAEVSGLPEPELDRFEYDAFEWADAARVDALLTFRALREGFVQLRRYITEASEPDGLFRLA